MNKKAWILSIALVAISGASRASVTYDYAGSDFSALYGPANSYVTSNDNVTGSITFNAPLAANAFYSNPTSFNFSFNSGLPALTNNTAGLSQVIDISTDASGNIDFWYINLIANGEYITTASYNTSHNPAIVSYDSGYYAAPSASGLSQGYAPSPGQFTLAAAVPEPSTWAMVMLGFCGIGFMANRRRRSGPSLRPA